MSDAATQGAEATQPPAIPHTDEAIIAAITEQEAELRFDSFDHTDAWKLGNVLVALAQERQHPVSIAVLLGEQRAFQAGLPGSTAENDDWIMRKARTVRIFDHASWYVGARFRLDGRDFAVESGLDPELHAAHGGAFPIHVGDELVGVVAVSGLTQATDHALVIEALRIARV